MTVPVGDTCAYCPTFPAEVVDWGVSGRQSALGKIQELSLSARGAGLGRLRPAREGFRRLSGTGRPWQRPGALWPQHKDHASGRIGGCLRRALCRRKPLPEGAGSLGVGQRGPEITYPFPHPLLSLGCGEQAQSSQTWRGWEQGNFSFTRCCSGLGQDHRCVHPDQPQRHDFGEPFLRLRHTFA